MTKSDSEEPTGRAVDPAPRPARRRRGERWIGFLVGLLAATAIGAQSAALFPEPFRIEHHMVQSDGSGEAFVGDTLVDTYGGSWLVSERPDGSRLIIDFGRRELTEARVGAGTYWSVTFDQLGAIERRLWAAQQPRSSGQRASARAQAAPAGDDLVVAVVGEEAVRTFAASGTIAGAGGVARHLRVARQGETGGDALDVWVDPTLVVGGSALAALDALSSSLASSDGGRLSVASAPGRYLAAARQATGGAWVVRTLRPLAVRPDGEALGSLEDVTTRIERLPSFPSSLIEIPEGLRRMAHPLEAAAKLLEEDATRDATMAGYPSPAEP